jgi:hypothetical protein
MYFTVKAGVATTAKHLGLTLLKPHNGAQNVALSPSFSWAPQLNISGYELVLATDPALSDIVVKTTVTGTAYEYDDILEPNTVYFWQVKATRPSPSDPSPVATFTTITTAEETQTEAPKKVKLPSWIWAVIGIYSILMIVMIVFASVKPAYFGPPTKRVSEPLPPIEKPRPVTAPRPLVQKPRSSFFEKLRSPFDRIAEAVSPRIRQRHYLDELEERGIVKPEPIPAEEIPRASLLSRLKSTILSRFRKKQRPESGDNFEQHP